MLGVSDHCIAAHPSDLCVALAILDATVRTQGPRGERSVRFADFHLAPGDAQERETVLEHGELVTAVELPAAAWAAKSHYLKFRDRTSFEFALASAAVALEVKGGAITSALVALGGVAEFGPHVYGTGVATGNDLRFSDAFGGMAEAGILFGAPLSLGGEITGRFTAIEYSAMSGKAGGLSGGVNFAVHFFL